MAMSPTALDSQGLRDVKITVHPDPAPEVWQAAGMEQAYTFTSRIGVGGALISPVTCLDSQSRMVHVIASPR